MAYADDWLREITNAVEARLRLFRVTRIRHQVMSVLARNEVGELRIGSTHEFVVEAVHRLLPTRQVSLTLLLDASSRLRIQSSDYIMGW